MRDWTAELVPAAQRVKARVIVREDAVLCGREWFVGCLHALDPDAIVDWRFDEGDSVSQLVLNTYYHERKLKDDDRCQDSTGQDGDRQGL